MNSIERFEISWRTTDQTNFNSGLCFFTEGKQFIRATYTRCSAGLLSISNRFDIPKFKIINFNEHSKKFGIFQKAVNSVVLHVANCPKPKSSSLTANLLSNGALPHQSLHLSFVAFTNSSNRSSKKGLLVSDFKSDSTYFKVHTIHESDEIALLFHYPPINPL